MKRTPNITRGLPILILFIACIFILLPNEVSAACLGIGDQDCGTVILEKVAGGLFDVVGVILKPIASLLLGLMSLFTMIAGVFLNQVVKFTIIDMAFYLPQQSIDTTWGILRDIANMSFIFILLYTSILLIIGQRSVNDARKLIVNVVIAAILINFSMFITRLIIDASNLLALVFYKAVAPGALEVGASVTNTGISNSITNVLNISTLWKEAGTITTEKIITVGIFGSILLMVSAFVFIAIGLMLLIRYVILVFVIIFSPIAFVADIIPGTKPYFNQWKDALLNNAFFPAIFFLVMWVALTILNSLKDTIWKDGSLAGAFGSGTTDGGVVFTADNVGLIVNFLIVIIFIVASLLISKSMASKTAGGVDKIIGRATGLAGAGTFGMAGRLGRGTVGRAGNALANNEELKGLAASGGVGGRMARLALAAGSKTAKQSFDGRAAVGSNLGAGKAQKGGFTADVKARVKAETEKAKTYKASDALTKEVETESKEAANTHTQARANAAEKFETEHPRPNEEALVADRKVVADIEKEIEDEKNSLTPSTPEEVQERATRLERARAAVETHEAVHKADLERYENERRIAIGQATTEEAEKEKLAKEREYAITNRQGRYAETLEKPMWFSPLSRIGFIGMVKRENKESAAAIRKEAKGKSKKEKAEEATREYMEDLEKKKKEEEGQNNEGDKPEKKDGDEENTEIKKDN